LQKVFKAAVTQTRLTSLRADYSHRHRLTDVERVPYCKNDVANLNVIRITDRKRRQSRSIDLKHSYVARRIGPYYFRTKRAAIVELDRHPLRVVHNVAEEGRVAVRNIRRDVMHDLRELKKEGEVGEDDERRAESELQRLTDEATSEIESLLKGKEEEILEV